MKEIDKEKMNTNLWTIVEFMKNNNKSTGAAVSKFTLNNCEGGVDIEISVRQHGAIACDEFSFEQLKAIKELAQEKQQDKSSKLLQDIIEVCDDLIENYEDKDKNNIRSK